MNKKIVIITGCVLALGIVGIGCGFAWKNYNHYEAKQVKVSVELGEKISQNPADYLETNQKALEKTELDTSKVDTMTAGNYEIKAVWKNHTIKIPVEVKDTTKPEITIIEKEHKIMVGQELRATDLIKKVEDLAGIKTVSFKEHQTELKSDSKNPLDKIGLKFDKAGTQKVIFTAEDVNGNKTTKEITVKVIEDYLAHVNGFKDITMIQGESPDWMEGIEKDEKIAELTADATNVDINTPGEYTLKYIIKGDDNETTLEQAVKVTVKEKPKPAPTPKKSGSSGGSSSSGNSTASSGGSSTSGNDNSGNGNSASDETWSTTGTKTDEGKSEETGINYEGGTFEIP